jgi:hypothetical protein
VGNLLKSGCALAIWCSAATAFAQAAPFSADMVITVTGKAAESMKQLAAKTGQPMPTTQTGKVNVAGMKMRWEMTSGLQQGAMLVDMSERGKSYMIQTAQKTYVEFGDSGGRQGRRSSADVTQFLRSGGDMCKAGNDYASCRKLGTEKIAGRACNNYEVVSKTGHKETICIDEKLHFPIRIASDSAITEMKNVTEGPQPPALFVVPAGFTKTEFGK